MADLEVVLRVLREHKHLLAESLPTVPAKPGLYAIHGGLDTWRELGLVEPDPLRPLYVGKAEDSLVSRDIKTHFGNGRTGSSTVRRSFAALLHDSLDLRGVPRNPKKPSHFTNYGLSSEDDERLTTWMRARLELAVWPTDAARPLVDYESEVLRAWQPPINISGVNHRWRSLVKARRSVMAEEARNWRPA